MYLVLPSCCKVDTSDIMYIYIIEIASQVTNELIIVNILHNVGSLCCCWVYFTTICDITNSERFVSNKCHVYFMLS